jgi:hypothetical protein
MVDANRRIAPDETRSGESKLLGRRGWDRSSGVRGRRRVPFAWASAEGAESDSPEREDSAPAASRGCFPAGQRSQGDGARRGLRGDFVYAGRCLRSRIRWGRSRGLSAPKFSGCVGRLNVERRADKGCSSLLRSSRHSTHWSLPRSACSPSFRGCVAAILRSQGTVWGWFGALLGSHRQRFVLLLG